MIKINNILLNMENKSKEDLVAKNEPNEYEKSSDAKLFSEEDWTAEYVPRNMQDKISYKTPKKYKKQKCKDKEIVTEKENVVVKWKNGLQNSFDEKNREPVIEKDVDYLRISIIGEIVDLKIDSTVRVLEIVCNYDSVFKIEDCKNIEKIKIKSASEYASHNYQTVYINNCPNLKKLAGANFIVETKLDNLKILKNKGDYPCEMTLNSISSFCQISISSFYRKLTLDYYKPDIRIQHLILDEHSTIDICFLDQLTELKTLSMYMVHLSPNLENFRIKNPLLKELIIIEDLGLPSQISCPILNKLVVSTMGGFDVRLSDLPLIEFPSSITFLEFYIPSYSDHCCSDIPYDESLSTWSQKFTNLEKLDIVQKDPLCIEHFTNSFFSLKELTYRNTDKTFQDLLSFFPNLIKDKCDIWGDYRSI